MSAMKIHGKEYVLAKIFSGDEFAFVIPEYQRPYAWTTEQAGELLDDLLAMMGDDDRLPTEELPLYFLGSIVLIKEEGKAESTVVDGQQRITTLTILLSALREVGSDDSITPFLYQAKQRHVVGSEDRYRLLLRDEDREFFKDYVQDRDGFQKLIELDVGSLTDSRLNFCQNAKVIHELLLDLSEPRRERLVRFILNQCVLIVVTSLDRDSAYRIFSILNDRGLDLSHTDILKAEIIGGMSTGNVKSFAKKWVDLEDALGREAFEDLFAHIRMIYRKAKMRESILKEFREYVVSRHPPQELVNDVLLPYGESFGHIVGESFESTRKAEHVNALFSWLNRIDNADWIPPGIAFLTVHRNEPDDVVRFFTLLERLAASMFIRRVNITKRLERYGRLLKLRADGTSVFASDSPLELSNDEKRQTIRSLDGNVYDLPRVPLFVLQRLDCALGDGTATYNYKTISIEHVLPQNPDVGSQWLDLFPDQEERAVLTHKIGNLVLLNRRKNASASNYDFDTKKDKYFKKGGVSPFPLTTDVLTEVSWTPDVIRQRQKRLLARLAEVWRLN